MSTKIISTIHNQITFQSYDPQPQIEGVIFQPLKKHRQLEGWFIEHLRLTNGSIDGFSTSFNVRQISISHAEPHRINAFHIHTKEIQDEIWCVIDGTLFVWLADLRDDSKTKGVRRKYILSAEDPALFHIPTGVAHGYKTGVHGATLIYAMNNQFNLADPNEGRLPWDVFGEELWEEERG